MPLPLRRPRWRTHRADPLRTAGRAWRAEPDEPGAAPTDTAEPPDAPPPPAPPSRTASLLERLIARVPPERRSLYASAALVVAIVAVIIALASRPSHRVLRLLPKDLTSVVVLDVGRFLSGPLHQALNAVDHPAVRSLDALEELLDVDLRRQVSRLVATDQGLVLLGRFRPRRLRSAYEESVQDKLGPRTPYLHTRYVDEQAYVYCSQMQEQAAFAVIGSSMATLGTRHGVRRLLKVRAGLFDSLARHASLPIAYDDRTARRATAYRLEGPGGPLLESLQPILAPAEAPVAIRAAFFALATGRDALALTVRLVTTDEKAGEALANHLEAQATADGLRQLIGADEAPAVSQSQATVTLKASVPIARLAEIVKKNKEQPATARSLLIDLIAK